MDMQQTFEKIVNHLLNQKVRAMATGQLGPGCAYRGENNTSCAIGCMIPDNDYEPAMEGRNVAVLFDDFPKIANHFKDLPIEFLTTMQTLHDTSVYGFTLNDIHFAKHVDGICIAWQLKNVWKV